MVLVLFEQLVSGTGQFLPGLDREPTDIGVDEIELQLIVRETGAVDLHDEPTMRAGKTAVLVLVTGEEARLLAAFRAGEIGVGGERAGISLLADREWASAHGDSLPNDAALVGFSKPQILLFELPGLDAIVKIPES